MATAQICLLPERGVIEVGGPEARAFLQGLITNNMDLVSATRAISAALLTPQGKYLFDFLIVQQESAFLLDCEIERLGDLVKRLNFYKLRAKVTVRDASAEFSVAAMPGPEGVSEFGLSAQPGAARPYAGGALFTDPRLAAMGVRIILPPGELATLIGDRQLGAEAYHRLRLEHGVAEGKNDITIDKYFLLEANFEELHGVDFKKGCYVGQELVSRMKHRGVVRKRILPVQVEGPCPPPGTPILAGGREVGVLHSSLGPQALAYLRLAALTPGSPPLDCAGARLTPIAPEWLPLTFDEDADAQD